MIAARVAAVFFDVDFTLIYPGPTFQGEGYARFAAQYGITIDRARFGHAVRAASSILDEAQEHTYDADVFVRYTRRIVQEMGGRIEVLTSVGAGSTFSVQLPPASESSPVAAP